MLGQIIVVKKSGMSRTTVLYSLFTTLAIIFTINPPLFAFDLPPLDSSNGFVITGEAVDGRLGGADKSISAIGDINGDGIDDFALSASNFDHFYTAFVTDPLTGAVLLDANEAPITEQILTRNTGRVYVIFGRSLNNPFTANFDVTKLITGDANGNAEQGFVLTTSSGSEIVTSIGGNCDVNGDGYPDLIIGAPNSIVKRPTTSFTAGEVYVIYGHNAEEPFKADISVESLRDGSGGRRDGGLCRSDGKSCPGDGSGSFGMVIKGSAKLNEAGKSVVCLKDINGDGIDDVFVGTGISNTETTSKPFEQGKAYVMYGANNLPGLLDLQDLEANGADGSKGFQITAATFIAEANPIVPTEEVPIPERFLINTKDDFSKFSANAGDMNGDGINDFIIAAPSASPNGKITLDGKYQSGQTYVIFGRQGNYPATLSITDHLLNGDGSIGFAINGMCTRDKSGLAISSAGDINADGLADIIIGTHKVNLYVDTAGSVNLDCSVFPEQRKIISGAGQSYIILGRSPGIDGNYPAVIELGELAGLPLADGSTGMIIHGATPGASGFSVTGLGDFDGDGFDDVAIAAPFHNSGEGAIYIMRGRDATIDKTQQFPAVISLAEFEKDINNYGFIIHGAGGNEKAGSLIAYAGDINNDTIPDLLIGVPDVNTSNILKIKTGEIFTVYGANDIDQREVRPESHKGATPNNTKSDTGELPQNGVGHLWWLLAILALGQTYKRLRVLLTKRINLGSKI